VIASPIVQQAYLGVFDAEAGPEAASGGSLTRPAPSARGRSQHV